jgi:SH3 domain protein
VIRIGCVVLGYVILFLPAIAFGKSLYVRDNAKETLVRTGPSTENKIISILKSGQEVTLVGEQENYYLVTTPGGSRGYVLKYQMTEQSPAEKRIQEIEQRSEQRIQELEAQTQTQQRELTTLREERAQLDTARIEAEERARQHADMVAQLQAQQSARESEEALRWFLAGAGVLLLGVLFGRLWGGAARKNKRGGLTLG